MLLRRFLQIDHPYGIGRISLFTGRGGSRPSKLVAAAVRRQTCPPAYAGGYGKKPHKGGMKKPLAIPNLVVSVWRAIMVRQLTMAATLFSGRRGRRPSMHVAAAVRRQICPQSYAGGKVRRMKD